jgi:hypothetical protein
MVDLKSISSKDKDEMQVEGAGASSLRGTCRAKSSIASMLLAAYSTIRILVRS